jgi:hypothetical protein
MATCDSSLENATSQIGPDGKTPPSNPSRLGGVIRASGRSAAAFSGAMALGAGEGVGTTRSWGSGVGESVGGGEGAAGSG